MHELQEAYKRDYETAVGCLKQGHGLKEHYFEVVADLEDWMNSGERERAEFLGWIEALIARNELDSRVKPDVALRIRKNVVEVRKWYEAAVKKDEGR